MIKMRGSGAVALNSNPSHGIEKIFPLQLNWKMGIPGQLIDTPKNTEKAGFPSVDNL